MREVKRNNAPPTRKKLVANRSRRECVYKQTGAGRVTFCGKEKQGSGQMFSFYKKKTEQSELCSEVAESQKFEPQRPFGLQHSRPCILNPLLPVCNRRKPITTNPVFGRKTRVFQVQKTKIRGTTSVTDFFVQSGNSKGIPNGILENRLEFSDFQPGKANLSVQNLAIGCGLPVPVSGGLIHRKS